MSTSEQGGLIKGLPSLSSSLTDKPASSLHCRTLVNNVNHVADQRSRVLVNYADAIANGGASTTTHINGAGLGIYFNTQRIYSFGPFPINRGADGGAKFRVRLSGRTSTAAATSYGILYVGVCPVGDAETWLQRETNMYGTASRTWDNVRISDTMRDTTNQDRMLFEWIPGGYFPSSLISVDSSFLNRCLYNVPVLDSVGGLVTTKRIPMVTVEVWGSCIDNAGISTGETIYCSGVYVAEVIGV